MRVQSAYSKGIFPESLSNIHIVRGKIKMRKLFIILLVSLLAGISINAQTTPTSAAVKTATEEKPKKQIFRAKKRKTK